MKNITNSYGVKELISFFVGGIIILGLSGCARYKARPLKTLATQPIKNNKKISFGAKAFDKIDSEIYLGRNLLRAGFIPVQIAIENESENTLKFELSKINMKAESAGLAAESVYFSPVSRGLAYGIPALFVLGIPLLVAAIVDPIWACEANEKLLSDYINKALVDSIIVPNSSIEGIVFVTIGNYKNSLQATLVDVNSHKKIICEANLQ